MKRPDDISYKFVLYVISNVTKMFILHPAPAVSPYQSIDPAVIISIYIVHETWICNPELAKQIQGFSNAIISLLPIYLLA